jgi:two-component system response regulator FixJ
MPEMNGQELQKKLHEVGCRMPVVIVTGHGDIMSAVSTMKHGAIDFIQKPFCKDDLIVAATEAWAVLDQAAPDPEECLRARELVSRLTPREAQVLAGLVNGQPNKVIAYELGISPRTVELYRANAMRRLSARSLSEMLHLAFLADLPAN